MDLTIDSRRPLLESESVDPVSYICVNPYEVNPVARNSDLDSATLQADIPLKVESSASRQNLSGIDGGVFYSPPRKIKLEMEEFGDLSPFVSQKQTISNSLDELNTPIFDKDAFDFDISNYQRNVHADVHVTLKCDASFYRENNSNRYQEDIFLNSESLRRNAIANINNQQFSNVKMYSPPATLENGGTYVQKMSPNTPTMFDFDINSVSVNNYSSRHSSYPPSPNIVTAHIPMNMSVVMETPEGSEKSFESSNTSPKPRLSLDMGLPNPLNDVDITTPSIIAEVVSLESTGFNILDLINDDTINLASDEVFPSALISNASNQYPTKVISTFDRAAVKQPKKRRHKIEEDDDEDYVPPTKKNSRSSVNSTKRSIQEYYSDSDSDVEEKPLRKARGRPPKRAESVSSDCSKDSDISKYRELRDKNNEASRKSRLKRKIKELEQEKECEELHNKNIKLKAQVEELEKMVNNFRDNLFKIMINK